MESSSETSCKTVKNPQIFPVKQINMKLQDSMWKHISACLFHTQFKTVHCNQSSKNKLCLNIETVSATVQQNGSSNLVF